MRSLLSSLSGGKVSRVADWEDRGRRDSAERKAGSRRRHVFERYHIYMYARSALMGMSARVDRMRRG
ncbi:unnamed protein product [Mycena citricolor]|uniref:Uncharacterized protein n=1 Tax=Mycena citricolor TaxID=2018698 RepID=A0AAD2GZD8_9AGAR|nr:unnamed protein product [Mycena citricolor]